MQQQQQQTLNRLRSQPAAGRLVITISSNISEWENTPADIFLRAGDVITIPRKPNFVLAYGQVYNPTAITYDPGKTAEWYLAQAGGPTELALKKAIYVIRANGSVVSSQGSGWFKGSVLDTKLRPGDMLVVPEKALGWIYRLEDCPGDRPAGRQPGRCRCRCCSFLNGVPILMRVQAGEFLLCCCLLARSAAAQSPAPQPASNPAVCAHRTMTKSSDPCRRSLPKNLLEDQEAFLTTPFRMRSDNLFFIVPAIFASSILVGSDTAIEAPLAQRLQHYQPGRQRFRCRNGCAASAPAVDSFSGDK